MKVPHHLIAKFPQVGYCEIYYVIYYHNLCVIVSICDSYFPILVLLQVLNTKYLRIRERHMFLDYLGKAQYDPSLPSYIPLDRLVSLTDDTFCTTLAAATLDDFTEFQKTIWTSITED